MYFVLRYFACALLGAILFTSCAARTAYYEKLNGMVAGERYAEAAVLAEQSKKDIYGDRNALLYYLDRGMLLHLSGSYDASNEAFEQAKRVAEEHFTKSVTTEMSTLLVSDNMRPYYGEDFERAFVNVFCALNYLMLGREDEALVEARQVDHLLKTLQVDYGRTDVYKEDAFARYLAGMMYENRGEINDAFISYRQALDAYNYYEKTYGVPVPRELVADALRTARGLGFPDEAREIMKAWGEPPSSALPAGSGELVVLGYNGFSPEKVDSFLEISFGKGWLYVGMLEPQGSEQEQVAQAGAIARSIASDEQVRIAFPKYMPVNYHIKNIAVSAGGEKAGGVLVEDMGAIAVKGLEDRITRVRVRAIARGVIKFALAKNISRKVEESSGEVSAWLAKTIIKAASTATELSDKRSWRSLPDKIVMARLVLPAGKQSVQVRLLDGAGYETGVKTIDNIDIKAGRKNFLIVRSAQ